jgi:glycosyltransferase involved in cell wall biosynthesis/peptidoglycan/xylan/chitin deacetylase (PgdA/CDA1 family)
MILNRAYYIVKPLLPWRLRMALRRERAAKRRASFADAWPIDPASGETPPNWPGWPEGKKFAFVLTHDVEGSKGVSRVEKLVKVEAKHGFRSSFNFVPEGEYPDPVAQRDLLDQNGFEVGIHGLEHDGKLYNSKDAFSSKAVKIQEYMRRWNAKGFRSPLMQHRLSWLHRLNPDYDASTFDTDPFEPQPDGVGTIFPFWVAGPRNTGYVELPYTLVQDFSLFVVLREPNIDIWKRKLDWIAERGGMALLNTHPDYMCFDGSRQARDEFPVALYEEFLKYAREKYKDDMWSALPREVSRYYRAALPVTARNTRKKVCMLTYSTYEADNRVRRYAEALAERGDQVDVIAISGSSTPKNNVNVNGVTAFRLQHRDRNEKRKLTYAWRWLRFFVVSSWFLARRNHRVKYDLVHVHNPPDFLAFAAWYPKWTGAKLILDIHDIVPELFASKFESRAGGRYTGVLKKIEKSSTSFVDHVIVSNHLWQQTLISRSVPLEKCSVFVNHVDPRIFYRRPRTRNDGKFIIIFPGSFQWHQGLDIAIQAFNRIKDKVPNAEFHLYGGGPMEASLKELTARLDLNDRVKFFGNMSLDLIAGVISNADLGVVPKRSDSFGNEAYSTKIMEFMSQGVPVVLSKTKIDSFYFDEKVVRFFPSGDIQSMADAMLEVIQSRELREDLVARGLEYSARNDWSEKKKEYFELVDTLITELFDGADLEIGADPESLSFSENASESDHKLVSK